MSIFSHILLAVAASALAVPAVAVQAQGPTSSLRPSEPAMIVAAAQSCRAAVTAERLDEARLTADGWGRGSISGSSGDGLVIFSRNNVLLFATPGSSLCMLVARVRNMRAYPQLSQAFTAAFGAPSQAEQNGTQTWLWEDGKAMRLEATGSRDSPAVRVSIMNVAGNSSGTSK